MAAAEMQQGFWAEQQARRAAQLPAAELPAAELPEGKPRQAEPRQVEPKDAVAGRPAAEQQWERRLAQQSPRRLSAGEPQAAA